MNKDPFLEPHPTPKQKNGKKILADTNISMEEVAQIIRKGASTSSNSIRDRALFATLSITGCRVSELLSIRKKDVQRFYQTKKSEDAVVSHLLVDIKTEKNKVQHHRKVAASYLIYKPLIDLLYAYIDNVFYGEETDLLFPLDRSHVWRLCKFYYGVHYSPHWFRHFGATFDAKFGYGVHMLQKKYGWASIASSQPYMHLNTQDILEFQQKKVKEIKDSGIVKKEELSKEKKEFIL